MRLIGTLAFASCSLFAFITPAFAQDTATTGAAEAVTDDMIIVQARRRDESVQDVPLVVQAVTAQQIDRLEIRQFEDVARVVPGLDLTGSGTGTSTTTSLRGVGFDALASGSSTTVEFYRNDGVVPAAVLYQSVYDIEQIEVLRGPQGTLRGRASPSGSITVTTRRPDLSEAGGYVSGLIAEDSKWAGNGAINVPVIADKLGVRVAGFVGSNRGSEVAGLNTVTGQVDSRLYDRAQNLRASVRANPLDDILVLDFSYETINRKTRQFDQVESRNLVIDGAPGSPVTIASEDRLGVGALARMSDQRYKVYSWQGQLRLFDQLLTYVGSKVDTNIVASTPQDFSGLFGTSGSVRAPSDPFALLQRTSGSQTSHEIRLQNEQRVAGMFDYVVGAMEVSASSPTLQGVPGNAAAAGTTLYNFARSGRYRYREDREQSIFGNLTLHLGDRTEISGGLRQIWFKADSGLKASSNVMTDPETWSDVASVRRCFGHSSVPGCKETKTATIYSASAKHNFSEELMAYASYGTSWRPGNSVVGFTGAAVGPFLGEFLNLPDEDSESFEVGIKSSWFDNRLRFNISGYYQKFTNFPFRVSTPIVSISTSPTLTPGTPAVTAAPGFNFVAPVPVEVKGFEADLAFDVTPSFNITASVSYADGKIKNGVFPCHDLNDDNIADSTAPSAAALYAHVGDRQIDTCTANARSSSAAPWSGMVQAEYRHPINDWGEGFVRGFANWKGHADGDSINPIDQVRSYALIDLFGGIRDPNGIWEVTAFVKNVMNTRRVLTREANPLVTSLVPNQNLAPFGGTGTSIASSSATNYLAISTIAPREVGISLRFALGSR